MAYFWGTILGGTIAVGFTALIIRGILSRLFRNAKDLLLVSCIIAVLLSCIVPLFFGRQLDVDSIVAYIISGCFAFLILRRRFKHEAQEALEIEQESAQEDALKEGIGRCPLGKVRF
jgi:4-amino-4-deoxy-L-arabinose transferase-like glycosyltransferase